MHIAYAADKRYLQAMTTSIASVVENCSGQLHFHILYSDIVSVELEQIETFFCNDKVTFSFYEITPTLAQEFTLPQPHNDSFDYLTLATYYRLFLPKLLSPSISKVIYLDCDTLVLHDINHLYNIDLKSKLVAAVVEPYSPSDPVEFRYNHLCDLNITDYYFNAGVLILNLTLIREVNLLEKAIDIIKNYPVCFYDQDILNMLFQHKTLFLQPKYNSLCFAGEPFTLNFFRYFSLSGKPSPYTEEMTLEAVNTPSILHFFGKYKPWHFPGLYFKNKEWFWFYYNKTPYRTDSSMLLEKELFQEAKSSVQKDLNY